MGDGCIKQREVIPDILGDVVKSARQEKQMTQIKLAELLSISTRHLKSIENGYRKPSYDLLVRIIHELDIPADAVFHPECEEKSNE